jgi:hypothetical protein
METLRQELSLLGLKLGSYLDCVYPTSIFPEDMWRVTLYLGLGDTDLPPPEGDYTVMLCSHLAEAESAEASGSSASFRDILSGQWLPSPTFEGATVQDSCFWVPVSGLDEPVIALFKGLMLCWLTVSFLLFPQEYFYPRYQGELKLL